ncbi:hypothetical protein O1W71_01975 [Microbacterium sp. H37-C3]|uniref:hypothetical protein n=1 Tax=Microbacterium sp. H37-C3 TaxID=3004354 RepID=UPI0022AF5EA1|nr:hypothetical protein [Microbacterium sp. H37-C3]MCZ4066436.1 hypothetical protein [Microbacterium sp. H37-C3]
MTDINDFTTRTFVTELPVSTAWRTSKHGQDTGRPMQLDAAAFTGDAIAKYDMENGPVTVIKSGVAVAEKGDLYVPWAPEATDGTEVLAGFINNNQGVIVRGDGAGAKPTASLLIHGIVDATRVPVPAQRDALLARDFKTTASITIVEG